MKTHRALAAIALCAAAASPAAVRAQSLAQRVSGADGIVQIIYPSRPGACGDGRSNIGHVFGHSMSGGGVDDGDSRWGRRVCLPGPVRLEATVLDGEVTRLRPHVGPVPSEVAADRRIDVAASDAAEWLGRVVSSGTSRAANDAILPLVLADAPDPWPLLLRVARDDDRPRSVRTSALFWIGNAIIDRLGLDDHATDTPDDEMRSQAVFVLSQRPRSESIPELIDIARENKHAAARRAAIFWLGQSGDPRAAGVFAALLGAR